MLNFMTKMFRKKDDTTEHYTLPSDDPEINPILVEDTGEDLALDEVASLNSQLLMPTPQIDAAGMSVRTRAVVEMKHGLNDLASHIRVLGQRLHAQSMGQTKLIEALSNLPHTIKEAVPGVEEQTNALAAVKLALDDQTRASRTFIEALRPLPQFMQAVSKLPEAAQQQMLAITELTRQLDEGNRATKEQGEQVRVMVEKLTTQGEERSVQVKEAVTVMTKLQKAQLKQAALAAKAQEASRASQRRRHTEMVETQQQRLTAMQRDQGRHFGRIEEHFRRSSKRQIAFTGAAVGLAVGSLVLAVMVMTGLVKLPVGEATPTAVQETERNVDGSAVVEGR
jgi:hypothetical protein